MITHSITKACKGRERTCTQCGSTYRAQRSTSIYCSTSCRQKGNRGTPAKALRSTQWSPITKALHKVGYIGISGPANKRSDAPVTYSLTVQQEHAYGELSYHFNRRGWGYVSKEEFSEALRTDGIEAFYSLSPAAIADKLWRDRNNKRLQRQA
jgi:hypothetical protein